MSHLSEETRKAVQLTFPNVRISYGESPDPIITFHAIHPDFGSIEVVDDGFELTVYCGNFTHIHLGNYDKGSSREERDKRIVADLVEFLAAVFSDRMEFWGSHRGGGGCRLRETQSSLPELVSGGGIFTWSGPVKGGR
jgi:hypothetical protein